MDLLGLDFSIGKRFSASVWDCCRSSVSSAAPAPGFLLLIAFGRCKIRLGEGAVGIVLESLLGGFRSDFKTLELEDKIFQISVSSQRVGFLVYKLGKFSCHNFEAFFHLWNANGLAAARKSRTRGQVPEFQWVQVKNRRSFADAVKSGVPGNGAHGRDILTGANRIPVNHSRARYHANGALSQGSSVDHPLVRTSVFHRLRFPGFSQKDQHCLGAQQDDQQGVPLAQTSSSAERSANNAVDIQNSKSPLRESSNVSSSRINLDMHLGPFEKQCTAAVPAKAVHTHGTLYLRSKREYSIQSSRF